MTEEIMKKFCGLCTREFTPQHYGDIFCSYLCALSALSGTAIKTKSDNINHPDHYTVGGIETWDFITAKLTKEEAIGACKANIIKYVSRAAYKGKAIADYKKAQWYMNQLVELTKDA